MNEEALISHINVHYLNKYISLYAIAFLDAIEGRNKEFIPYNSNPKHYILSIYDPLELNYVLLGYKNYSIHQDFKDESNIDNKLISFYGLDAEDENSKYDSRITLLKRKIEYLFLRNVLDQIESQVNSKIQLYITQHVTDISYDISAMKSIDDEYLWEHLEE
ncbi:MAG: hypothetical protein P1U56_05855 [Saprospiraceae bacterium]|nr:hypothetical protein [Saprospiraceae bacterium]